MGCEAVYCDVKPPAHCVSFVIASLSRLAGYIHSFTQVVFLSCDWLLICIMQVQKISELSMVCVCVFSRAHEHVGVCMRSRVFVWSERERESCLLYTSDAADER